jgi:histidine triad (HIT) family protein
MSATSCAFCAIVAAEMPAARVFEDEVTLAFLDRRPLFPGHVLLVPLQHHTTLADLPPDLVTRFFCNAQLLALAVERGTRAEGTFMAINNRVSQSVPHLHLHIVPRRRGDGLRGFFWPRQPYSDDAHLERVRVLIQEEMQSLRAT